MIKPTIGRRVWYYASEYERGLLNVKPEKIVECDGTQPCDAGVVYVHSDRLVNLIVTDHNGNAHPRTSIQLVQPEDTIPTDGHYCIWMPYQTSQAK